MPSPSAPRYNSVAASTQRAASSKGFRPFGRTLGQHARLLATLSHPSCPVEAYPIVGICLFPLAYICVRFYQAKDFTDVAYINGRGVPWRDLPANDGRVLQSVYAQGDGVHARKFSYPKPESFFDRKFKPFAPSEPAA